MKKFLIVIFFLITIPVQAQDEERPWYGGIGLNTVDYQTNDAHSYNFHYTAFRFSAGRLLWDNFSAETSLSFNHVDNFAGNNDLDLNHTAIDIIIWYSFGEYLYQVGKTPVDPFLGVAAGRTWLKSRSRNEQANVLSLLGGVNFWLNPRLAIFVQAALKNTTDIFTDDYHEVVLGVRYTLSLSKYKDF